MLSPDGTVFIEGVIGLKTGGRTVHVTDDSGPIPDVRDLKLPEGVALYVVIHLPWSKNDSEDAFLESHHLISFN